jgi:hypothetical protein
VDSHFAGDFVMKQIKIVLASALFAVLAACGGGGASVADACDNACSCEEPGEAREECEELCPAFLEGAPDKCLECIADVSCSADSDACDADCGFDEE